MSVLIVTPLRREFDGIVRGLRDAGCAGEGGRLGPIDVATFPALATTVGISGLGKAQSAAQTQYLVDRVGPVDVVVCAGVAGALAPQIKVGDVVISTASVEHDIRRRISPKPLPVFEADVARLARVRDLLSRAALPFAVHFGAIASGDEDVVARDRAREVAEATGAICVAWEGAGVARVCQLNGIGFVEVRGVTDGADPATPADFVRHLDAASANVATTLLRWLVRD